MVVIQETMSHLLLSGQDCLVQYNLHTDSDQITKIPTQTGAASGNVSRSINCMCVSRDNEYIAVSTEQKDIFIYDKHLNPIKSLTASRTPSRVVFTPTNDVVVADKTGDVYLYRLSDNETKGVLLLSHLSMVLDVVLSECGKYIVTCDRDEKIRVSSFPNSYNIVSYCLGHGEFVTALKFCGSTLISASGDGTVRFWEYTTGKQLAIINSNEYVMEKDVIESVAKVMGAEKVYVSALPITDMQISCKNDLFIALCLYSYNYVQLYKSNPSSFESVFIRNIEIGPSFTLFLSDKLYVFTDSFLHLYTLAEDDFTLTPSSSLDKLHTKYKDELMLSLKSMESNAITVLYKKKYDAFEEYFERKKIRMESNNKND